MQATSDGDLPQDLYAADGILKAVLVGAAAWGLIFLGLKLFGVI